jgi:glutamyl-tRNA synthetase
LLAWWNARSRGGRVVLRVEDLDRERSKPELVEDCLRDLEWLGLDWDGPPLFQSAETAPLAAACERLLAAGHAYPCVCTRAEIAALSAPHTDDAETPYPGTCRGRWRTVAQARAASGREPGLRLVVPPERVSIVDELAGALEYDVAGEVGDFLVRRRDGAFAYQLAVVVDDARQGVTEVLRGDDLLSSAARQALVLERLGLPRPAWVHVPLVLGEDGRRLAKRRRDLALGALREAGVDPRAVVGWVARTAGQRADARPTARDVLATFDLAHLPRVPAVLGPEGVLELGPGTDR